MANNTNPKTIVIPNGFTGQLAEAIPVTPGKQITVGLKANGATFDVLVGLTDDKTDLFTEESGITADYLKSTIAGCKWISINVTVTPSTDTELQVLTCDHGRT